MKTITPANRSKADELSAKLELGKARKLTRASFTGIQSELVTDRVYTMGG